MNKNLLRSFIVSVALLLGSPSYAQPYDTAYFLGIEDAAYAGNSVDTPSASDSNGVAGHCFKATSTVNGNYLSYLGFKQVLQCDYDSGDDSYIAEFAWKRPFPLKSLDDTVHFAVLYQVHETTNMTECGPSSADCFNAYAIGVRQYSASTRNEWVNTSSNRYVMDSGYLSSFTGSTCIGTSTASEDGTSCSADSDCTGAGEWCWSPIRMTPLAVAPESMLWSVDGSDTPCDRASASCLTSMMKFKFRWDASVAANYDFRILGIFVIVNE